MSGVRLISARAALDLGFPWAESSLYAGKSRGRLPWIHRNGPDGHKGVLLWIDVDHFNRWAALRGQKYRLPTDGAVPVVEGWQH